jgi:putative membrane protein
VQLLFFSTTYYLTICSNSFFMKKRVLLYFVAVLGVSLYSCTDHEVGMVAEADRQFMIKAAEGNLFEIKAGELASMKAVVDSVKQYGHHMVMDHGKASEELKMLADKKMVTLPMALPEAKQKKLDSLSMLSGMAFDSTYMTMMVVSHVETIDLFKTETTLGEDAEVKGFAAGKLPTLQHHLEEAIKLKEWLW